MLNGPTPVSKPDKDRWSFSAPCGNIGLIVWQRDLAGLTLLRTENFAEPDIPRRGLGRQIHNCERAFTALFERRLQPHGLSPSHWHHLSELWAEDGITQVELSGRLGLKKASSTQVLEDLEALNLIERKRMKGDRRKIANFLTQNGRDLTGKVIDEMIELTKLSHRGVTDEELRAFVKVLHALTQNLLAALAEKKEPSTEHHDE